MIFSIGHANRTLDVFLDLLNLYNIKYLVDVRSAPYSRMFPVFNREGFMVLLQNHDVTYVYLGDALGGLPRDSSCYTEYLDKNNQPCRKVDYSKVETKQFFKDGMLRLINAESKGLNVAVMCSELSPQDCHRSKLIGLTLQKQGIMMQHIDKHGKLIDQNQLNSLINGGKNPINLWGEIDLTSKKKR